MRNSKFFLAAVAAYAIWGFFSLVLKPLQQYPTLDILCYRIFFCAAALLLISLFFRRRYLLSQLALFRSLSAPQKKKTLFLNIAGGILLTGNWFSFIYVMNHISVKATSLAYLVCPILTTLLAHLILKEKLYKHQWLAVALSIAGCVLLSYAQIADMLYSLVIALPYAFYLISQRENTLFDKFFILTVQVSISALLLLFLYFRFSAPLPGEINFYWLIIIISIFFTILPLWLNLYALKGISSSTAGMLININPLIAFSLAITVYRERVDSIEIIAYTIILVAVILFNASFLSQKKNQKDNRTG